MPVILKPSNIMDEMRDLERRVRILENTGRVTPAVVQGGWSVNKYKVYAFASANHTATDAAFNALQLDSLKYDNNNNWDVAAFQYTVAVAGVYHMESRAGCSMPGVNGAYQYWFVSIFVNGSEVTRGHGQSILQPNPGSFGVDLSSYVGSKLFLNVGDTVQFRGFPSCAGVPTVDGSAGGGQTYAMLHLLSTT